MLSFHFCMKSLNNGKTLSLGSENLWWFSRKPSVYIAIIYPNLIKFTYTNAGLDHWLLWSWRTPSAITRLGLVKIHDFIWGFVREALEERWNCKSWESILAADQGFPDIAFLFSSHEPLYECLGGQKLCFEKSRPWFLEISKFFKSKGSSLFSFPRRPADPRHRKWLGGVYLFGTDGCGPDTSVGSSFWDKMRYINILYKWLGGVSVSVGCNFWGLFGKVGTLFSAWSVTRFCASPISTKRCITVYKPFKQER